jgi:hypothetical protein
VFLTIKGAVGFDGRFACISTSFHCSPVLIVALISTAWAQDRLDLPKTAEVIQTLISAGKFAEAEPFVQKCLKEAPDDLYFLSQLDMVLHGRHKDQEAEKLGIRIHSLWKAKHESQWIAKGSPVAEATWARMFIPGQKYNIVLSEYFRPEMIGAPPLTITSYFKVIVLLKSAGHESRVFKLEMSKLTEEFYVLRELTGQRDEGRQTISYGSQKPTLRRLADDVVAYLNTER